MRPAWGKAARIYVDARGFASPSAGFGSSGSSGRAPGITLGTSLGAVSPDGTFVRGGGPCGGGATP